MLTPTLPSAEIANDLRDVTAGQASSGNRHEPALASAARVRLFGMDLDPLTMPQAVERLLAWTALDDGRCRYVVTPNADHAVRFQENELLRRAYADAGLVLVNGIPLLWAARLLGRPIPERVPGSDLAPALFAAAARRFQAGPAADGTLPQPLRIYLLGAAPGVAERAAALVEARWPGVCVVGCHSPPLGFEHSAAENGSILQKVAVAGADVLIVGLGAPKQELWVHAHRERIAAPVALCVGATIDFLAGEKRRAPAWMRRVGLEWLHRLACEPRRLAKRYLRDAIRLPGLLIRELLQGASRCDVGNNTRRLLTRQQRIGRATRLENRARNLKVQRGVQLQWFSRQREPHEFRRRPAGGKLARR